MLSNGWTGCHVFWMAYVHFWMGHANNWMACENYQMGYPNNWMACENYQTTEWLVKVFKQVDIDGWMGLQLISDRSWKTIAIRAKRIGCYSKQMDRSSPIHI